MADIIIENENDTVLIELHPSVLSQSSLLDNLLTISEALKNFLKSTILTAKESGKPLPTGNVLITRKQILRTNEKLDLGTSTSLISRRLSELVEKNVAEVVSRLKTHQYYLRDLSPLAALPHIKHQPVKRVRRNKSVIKIEREILNNDPNIILLDSTRDIVKFFHEQVFNGILDSGMRLSHKDLRTTIETTYIFAKSPLIIRTSCSTAEGSEIAILSDQKMMRALITLCQNHVDELKVRLKNEHGDKYTDSMIPNLFSVPIRKVCEIMDLKYATKNIERIVQMIRRISDTLFQVDARENEWFRDKFSLTVAAAGQPSVKSDIFEFRFLHSLEIANQVTQHTDTSGKPMEFNLPSYITFSLELRLFLSLLIEESRNINLSHPGLVKENSGIVQRIYNWARSNVLPGSFISQKWFTLDELHQRLIPAARFDNFRPHFLNALEKFAVGEFKRGERGLSLIYGYYLHYKREGGHDLFRIEIDKQDKIVGENSKHRTLLRQSAIEDAALIESSLNDQYDSFDDVGGSR